jgi:hypothetical protein
LCFTWSIDSPIFFILKYFLYESASAGPPPPPDLLVSFAAESFALNRDMKLLSAGFPELLVFTGGGINGPRPFSCTKLLRHFALDFLRCAVAAES